MGDKIKEQFKEIVNMFQLIEAYVEARWARDRQAVSTAAVADFCKMMNLSDLGVEVVGSLIAQSERIIVGGSPGAYHLVPRGVLTYAVKEN